MSCNVWQVFERHTVLPLLCFSRISDKTSPKIHLTAQEFIRRIQFPDRDIINPFKVYGLEVPVPCTLMLEYITLALGLVTVPSFHMPFGLLGTSEEFAKGFARYANLLGRYEQATRLAPLPIGEVRYQDGLFMIGQAPDTPRFCSHCAAPISLAFKGVPRLCSVCGRTTPLNPTVSPPPRPVYNESNINIHNHYPTSSPSVRRPSPKRQRRARWSGLARAT
jgi:hypothetical protein